MVKRKSILDVGESLSDVSGSHIRRRMQQQRGLSRMLILVSYDPEGIVVVLVMACNSLKGIKGCPNNPCFR